MAGIIECAFAVHNALGAGFLEKVYENALGIKITKAGLDTGLLINFGSSVEIRRKFRTYTEKIDRINKIDKISPQVCRRIVLALF